LLVDFKELLKIVTTRKRYKMKYYVISYLVRTDTAEVKTGEVFTKKASAVAFLSENFNKIGKAGADLIEMTPEELTVFANANPVFFQ